MTPTLDEVLNGYCSELVYRRVDGPCGANPDYWPPIVNADFNDAERLFRSRTGPIEIVADRYACIQFAGAWWCARQIHYVRVKSEQALPPSAEATSTETASSGPANPPTNPDCRAAASLVEHARAE